MTANEARDFLQRSPPVPISKPDMVGWEPLTHPIHPTNDTDVVNLVLPFLQMRHRRDVRIVTSSNGRLSIWEKTDRAEIWNSEL
jgi:hypothetical protein